MYEDNMDKSMVFTNPTVAKTDEVAVAKDLEEVERGTLAVESEKRAEWGNKIQFVFAIMGFAVGLGSVWRFPYLCQKNGGGAFLIPYVISVIFFGVPLFFLELAIGQRLRKGCIGVWNELCPKLVGVGITSVVTSFFISMYYNIIIGWCFYYLFISFQETLPYQDCPTTGNGTIAECELAGKSSYYWYRVALDTTDSISESGGLQLHLSLALLLSWIILFVCVIKGVKSAGKAVYFTATFPYLVLIIFFFRGITLEGASSGLKHMFAPQFEKLVESQVWLDAAAQTFFTFGMGYGGLIAMASFNPINNNCKRDALIVSVASCETSVFASVVVFSILGFKATKNFNKCWDDVHSNLNSSRECDTLEKYLSDVAQGPGLVFIAITEAITLLPVPQLWAILFFCMLLTLGLGGMLGIFTGMLTPILDLNLIPIRKEFLAGIVSILCCACGLLFCQRSGQYWIQLFDSYAPLGLLTVGLTELFVINYVYGTKKFLKDIEFMIGSRPGWYWMITWKVVAPVLVFVLLAASLVAMIRNPVSYNTWNHNTGRTVENVAYPSWAVVIILLLIVSMVIWIPLVAILRSLRLCSGQEKKLQRETINSTFTIRNATILFSSPQDKE